jgi:caffeoyl-CoA O-methyltransferase
MGQAQGMCADCFGEIPEVRESNASNPAGGISLPPANTRPEWFDHNITSNPVDEYLYSMLPPRDEVLAEMEAEAIRHKVPIVGPAVGRVLYQLASIAKAKTVFELGSAIGYSTIWWARAVGEKGRVTYTDGDPKKAKQASRYFERAGVSKQITIRTGDALEVLSEQKQEFDIIFNDVDKEDYPRVFRLALPRLRPGGLFITDNVLWSGRVAEKNPKDTRTKAIAEFNRLLYDSRDLFTTILPIRDGVAVAVKK